VSPGKIRERVTGRVPSDGQVSLSLSVGWGDTAFHATTTFLNGVFGEEVYLHEPTVYELCGCEMVCLLLKALYGRKQDSRAC